MQPPYLLYFAICCTLAFPQAPPQGARTPPDEAGPSGPRLPDGRSQREEILKADHKKSVEDAAQLLREAEEFKADLEKNDRYVLSVTTFKKLDNIEKLTKRIRSRLKRF